MVGLDLAASAANSHPPTQNKLWFLPIDGRNIEGVNTRFYPWEGGVEGVQWLWPTRKYEY